MSRDSYGAQMQAARADRQLQEDYFDAATAAVGDRVPYRDESDDTDDRAWSDAESALRKRGLRLHDDGSGYVIRAN
jgi:hypothetical protein